MLFKDIVGQERIISQLIANVQANRTGHALLFLGGEGSGNLPLALALGTYLHCKNRGENDACGECPSCLKMKKLEHPDMHFFFPAASGKDSKKETESRNFCPHWRALVAERPYFSYTDWLEAMGIENKQAIINAGDCNEIIRLLGLKSYESHYKIVMIYMIEKLYHAAAPKLLKILEEPPANTFFLMISENKDQILHTILSRCQVQKVPLPDNRAVEKFLINRCKKSHDDASRIASLSAGNVGEALKLAGSDVETFEYFEQFRTWMRFCYAKDTANILHWVEAASKTGRERQKSFLAYGLGLFRLCIAKNYNALDLLQLHSDERNFIDKFSPFLNHTNTLQIVDMFNQAIPHIERNANPRILFADMSFQIAKLLKPFQS